MRLDEAVCPHCGCPYQEDTFLGTEDSELIEVKVHAYRRKVLRKKYKKSCQCQGIPGIITAPGPGKLIDKGKLGISAWVTVLLEKYLYQRPINRLLESFKDIEFDIAAGTIGDGLKKLAPLFEPVLQQIIQRNQTERHLHADETRWQVFEFIEGKKSCRWYMWVFVSDSTGEAERRMRIPALGRKNYYGSGAVWSGHFTACLFSIFQTLKLWNVNPRKWLTQYLQACADNRGQVPDDLTCFLPWMMSAEQLARLQYPDTS